jgi:hypothetical protein
MISTSTLGLSTQPTGLGVRPMKSIFIFVVLLTCTVASAISCPLGVAYDSDGLDVCAVPFLALTIAKRNTCARIDPFHKEKYFEFFEKKLDLKHNAELRKEIESPNFVAGVKQAESVFAKKEQSKITKECAAYLAAKL